MKSYIKGIVVLAMVCGMSAIGEEAQEKESKDFSIRVSLGSASGVDEVESNIINSGALEDEGGGQLEVLAVKRFWSKNNPNVGGLFGGGIFLGGNSGKYGNGDEVELSAFGGMIEGGFIAKAGEFVVFELAPYVGLGGATVNISGFSEGSAPYILYGIKGGVFFLLGEFVELGVEAGIGGFSSEIEVEIFGNTGEATYSGDGFRGALVLVIKF